jgi:hypothetical protein
MNQKPFQEPRMNLTSCEEKINRFKDILLALGKWKDTLSKETAKYQLAIAGRDLQNLWPGETFPFHKWRRVKYVDE